MKVYLSGKITGLPLENKPRFEKITKMLREMGHEVINPHELCAHIPPGSEWYIYMRECIKALPDCQCVVVFDQWKDSKGAVVEVGTANILQIPVFHLWDFTRHLRSSTYQIKLNNLIYEP